MPEEIQPLQGSRIKDVPRKLKPYFLGWLVRGARWNDTEGSEAAELVPLQLAFLRAQIEAGSYALAGPVLGDERIVGFMIISAKTAEDALAVANEDPAVKAGRLGVEVRSAYLPSLDQMKVEY